MSLVLPPVFLERMQTLLGAEFPQFLDAMQESRINSLRVNAGKLEPVGAKNLLEGALGVPLEGIDWCDSGFYLSHTAKAGSHPLHAAGAYYIQEASAMAAAELLLGNWGGQWLQTETPRVLDLCAAPGGKASHLAQLLQKKSLGQKSGGTGFLVCNEFVAPRAKILAENLERLGLPALIMNEDPARLAQAWGPYFDAILLDAPCSGEGMFRKDPNAAPLWTPTLPALCARRQHDILECAAQLLRPGGRLVYSTCTFAPEENETALEEFLQRHPEFELLHPSPAPEWGFVRGFGALQAGFRLMPHHLKGEGHFMALLHKKDGEIYDPKLEEPTPLERPIQKLWKEFENQFEPKIGEYSVFKGEIQAFDPQTPSLERLKVVRLGTPIAEIKTSGKTSRLEPHHALSHFYQTNPMPTLPLEREDPRLAAYLRGETLELDDLSGDSGPLEGWILVQTFGLNLGWGKAVKGVLKNHYPKHLRQNS
jgi:16S rRNA C967 or C1407 C5-methylase (RsmB/RsmF family)/NOL1/NOP2/fmu family ribosome biogenesis protein